jgi:hypothetical protein
MRMQIALVAALVMGTSVCARAQDAPPPPDSDNPDTQLCAPSAVLDEAIPADTPAPAYSDAHAIQIPLQVPRGLPLQVELDREVHIREAGQAIHGKIVQPVYAFDRLVIPVDTEVIGRIATLEEISAKRRTLSALDANFTPDHRLEIEFDELVLPDGRRIPVHTVAIRGNGQVIEFVRSPEGEQKHGLKSAAAIEIDRAKAEAKRDWDLAMKEMKDPGRMHRLERYLVAQLPFHPQYLDPGTFYFAELLEPLDFGTTPLTPKLAASLARPIPSDSVAHAVLVTPLSSASAQRDDQVEAMLWQPLFDGEDLIRPAGSRLTGIVLQAHPAQKLHHNGELRLKFQELENPYGPEQKVSGMLMGVAVDKSQHLELDAEGGAHATAPPTRYLSTGIAVALAAASANTDGDARDGGGAAGNSSDRAAGGAGGFKLIGLTLGLAVHSQPLGMAMGALGASRSIYANFLGPGHEVTFPKHTPMELSLSPEHVPPVPKASEQTGQKQ